MSTSRPRARMTSPSRTTPAWSTGSPSPSADDELGRRRRDGDRGRRRIVGPALGGQAEGDEDPGHRDRAGDEDRDDAKAARERAHGAVRRHAVASSKTSTGVPISAKPKSISAS